MARIGSFFFLLFFPLFALSQVKVDLSVDEKQIALGDYLTIVIQVSADKSVNIEPPRMPTFADFQLIDQSTQVSDSVSIINGEYKFVRQNRYIYMYQTTKKGSFDIPPVQVIVDGKTYSTDGARVSVVDPGNVQNQQQARPSRPGHQQRKDPFTDPFEELEDMYRQLLRRRSPTFGEVKPIRENEAFAVRLEVDKQRAYVGEQITASYYIYVPEGAILRSIDTLKFPSLNNFWKEDIEIASRLSFEPAIVDGKRYNRALLASYALFPIKHGNLKLDSYKVKAGVASQSAFGIGKVYTYTKASDEVSVNVLPLPDANRPLDFNGAVGDFQIKASLEDDRFKTGQPFTMQVRISGKGNAKVIELPALNLPNSLELFDKKEEAKYFPNGQSYKDFSLYITPKEVGTIVIPPIKISYFDPSRMQYMTKETNEITIQVDQGDNYSPENRPLAENQNGIEAVQLPSFFATTQEAFFTISEEVTLWLFLSASLLTLLFYAFRLQRNLRSNQQAKILQAKVKAKWAKAKSYLAQEDHKKFSTEASNYIYFLVGEIAGEEGSVERLQKNLDLLPTSLRKEVEQDLLESIDFLQAMAFAPDELTASLRDKKKMKEIQQKIERLSAKLLQHKLKSLELT